MQQELISFGTIFMGLFAIMNPIANVRARDGAPPFWWTL